MDKTGIVVIGSGAIGLAVSRVLAGAAGGIRPKLQEEGAPFRDFVICDESEKGFPDFINLIGIESPGLTSCLAIAEMVKKIVDKY